MWLQGNRGPWQRGVAYRQTPEGLNDKIYSDSRVDSWLLQDVEVCLRNLK
jgi:hypothetical protein